MPEPKFRYRFQHSSTKEIITTYLTLSEVESQHMHPNTFRDIMWGILSRAEYTGQEDKNGLDIFAGDLVRRPVGINNHFHGAWSVYEVMRFRGEWLLSYVKSEKVTDLPRGYMRDFLLGSFDLTLKTYLWSESYKPRTELVVIGTIWDDPEPTGDPAEQVLEGPHEQPTA
ncbi:hypothetical protein LCGC14_0481220 [marine sediment metagenome]|uniref:YopX protein domain-containing protein n=1 Tax=marine sediment metagenome TaxID=412755 RepID=A0A0F9SSK5_9ZZZZ